MKSQVSSSNAGGFLLSPTPSSVASSAAVTTLPRPRGSPLRPGGSKESALIRHIDAQVLHVQRRVAKRSSTSRRSAADHDEQAQNQEVVDAWPGDVKGYTSMREACHDLDELVDVVWISGTPGLQVPYLISIALLLATIVGGMPPTPKSLFQLLRKLDHAFASLLQGRDVETAEVLPGFEKKKKTVSGTEKVRIRSLVERTRVEVMEAIKKGEFEREEMDADYSMDDMDTRLDGELILEGDDHDQSDVDDVDEAGWETQLARVYDQTIVELGDSLEAPNIGVITDRRG